MKKSTSFCIITTFNFSTKPTETTTTSTSPATTGTTTLPTIQPQTLPRYKNHLYYIHNGTRNTPIQANTKCHHYGGYLLEINDAQEYAFVNKLLTDHPDHRQLPLGCKKQGNNWNFLTSKGRMSFQNWYIGEPHRGLVFGRFLFDCVFLSYSYGDGEWRMYDQTCSGLTDRYVCEIPANAVIG